MYIRRQCVFLCARVHIREEERDAGVKIILSDDQCHKSVSSCVTYFFLSILHEVCWKG